MQRLKKVGEIFHVVNEGEILLVMGDRMDTKKFVVNEHDFFNFLSNYDKYGGMLLDNDYDD
jgi:hypothetical protein